MLPFLPLLGIVLVSAASAVQIRSYNKVNYEDLTSQEQLQALFPNNEASINLVRSRILEFSIL